MKNFKFFVLVFSFLFSVFSFFAFAKSENDIAFPVTELGNCKNKSECKAFCDKPGNMSACISFAKGHNLMSEEEAKKAQKVADLADEKGPGGCKGFKECNEFCDDSQNTLACITFAKEHGLMEGKELQEAQKVAAALRGGAKLPGGCASKEKCQRYCEDDSHANECIEFAHKAGFMQDKEYEIAKKTGGKGPGGCKGKECESYCEDESHFSECVAFGEEHGMISHKEAEMAKKTGGKGPGGCRGKECKEFCENPDNFEACLTFGKEHGIMEGKEEQEMMKSDKGKGPGGCEGEECRTYCEDTAHREECANFAKEHNIMMSPQHIKEPKEMHQVKNEEVKQEEGEKENNENIEEDDGQENQNENETEKLDNEDCPEGSEDCNAPQGMPQQNMMEQEHEEQRMGPDETRNSSPQGPPPPPVQPSSNNEESQPFIDKLGATLLHTLQFLIGKKL